MRHWRRGVRVGALVCVALVVLQVVLHIVDRVVVGPGGDGTAQPEAPLRPTTPEVVVALLSLVLVFAVVSLVATVVIPLRERSERR